MEVMENGTGLLNVSMKLMENSTELVIIGPTVMNTTTGVLASTTTEGVNNEIYLPNERMIEGLYLMMLAICGISLNFFIFCSVFLCKPLRTYMNGFFIHGCILDAFKSALCIPYSLVVLQMVSPGNCNTLGLAYTVSLTVSMFNLLAMVMAEAYAFHERNISDGEKESGGGAAMCIIFGVVTIYIGSIILHLGPTLIGGEFKFNKDVGNCTFAYGEVQHYIVHLIWIIIVTITMIVLFRYIYKFYRQLKANQRFRITNLARNAAAYTRGQNPDDDIYELVNKLKKRVSVLFCMAIIYCMCWYPLFFLTMLDYKYRQPRYLYRILTVVAWSHSVLTPIALLSLDHSFGIIHQLRQLLPARREQRSSPSTQPLARDDSTVLGSQHTSLYNHTMNSAGQSITYLDSPKINNKNYKVTAVDRGEAPGTPKSPARVSTGLLSDYDDLSLEESPL